MTSESLEGITDARIRSFSSLARTRLKKLRGFSYDVSFPIGMRGDGEVVYSSPGEIIATDLEAALDLLDHLLGKEEAT